jgi:hypothetical protein
MDERFAHDRFLVDQLVRPLINLYRVTPLAAGETPAGGPIAFVRQRRTAIKEDIRFYADENESQEVFRIKARSIFDIGGARYDVTAVDGSPIGVLEHSFGNTGIRFTHTEFDGGAVAGYDAVTAGGSASDCNGHGTHVAGTVGGSTYRAAKSVSLVAVRVLNCSGSGTTAGVIAGIDWVTGNHQAGQPAVANMSLGGERARRSTRLSGTRSPTASRIRSRPVTASSGSSPRTRATRRLRA